MQEQETQVSSLSPEGSVGPQAGGKGLHVLVVDDDPALATMAGLMVQQKGCTSETATSVEDALSLLQARRFDVVITDLGLEEQKDGWDLTREVRERWPETRVLLATGWGSSIELSEAQERGVQGVLAKPYHMEELWSAIQGLW